MSDYFCDICKTIEKPLIRMVKEDDEEVWICMKHLFMQMLDAGMKEMHNNMADYTGVLFNYKDAFKT
jgi:hypothetical protein